MVVGQLSGPGSLKLPKKPVGPATALPATPLNLSKYNSGIRPGLAAKYLLFASVRIGLIYFNWLDRSKRCYLAHWWNYTAMAVQHLNEPGSGWS